MHPPVATPDRSEAAAGSSDPSTHGNGFRHDIQGLRGIAVLIVVIFHSTGLAPGGFIGVDVFFVISGFVIMSSLLAEHRREGRVSLFAFFRRRIRRLYPALAVCVTGVALASTVAVPPDEQRETARTGFAALVWLANLALALDVQGRGYFDRHAENNPLVHTWSLSLEEQFYLVVPALLVLAWAYARRRGLRAEHAGATTAVVIIAVSLPASIVLTSAARVIGPFELETFSFYSPLTRAWEFAAGVLIASLWGRRGPARFGPVFVASGLALIALGSLTFSSETPFPGTAALVPVSGAALVIVAGPPTGRRLLTTRPLVWVGDRSYSWYLWHWPAIVLATFAFPTVPQVRLFAAAASLAPAAASYRWVENRYRERGAEERIPVPVWLWFAPFAAIAVLWCVNVVIADVATVQAHRAAIELPYDVAADCAHPEGAGFAVDCDFGAGPTVALVGDSNALHLLAPTTDWARSRGADLGVRSVGACPFVALPDEVFDAASRRCRRAMTQTREWLLDTRPDVVILGGAMDLYVEGTSEATAEVLGAGGQAADRAAVWQQSLRATLAELEEAGSRVLVVLPPPRFDEWFRDQCPAGSVLLSWCEATVSRSAALDVRARGVEATMRATDASAAASTFDPFDLYCPTSPCSTEVRDVLAYRDGGHYSIDGSMMLGEQLGAALDELTG